MNPLAIWKSGWFRLIFLVALLVPVVLAWSVTRTSDDGAPASTASPTDTGVAAIASTSTIVPIPPALTTALPEVTPAPASTSAPQPPASTPMATPAVTPSMDQQSVATSEPQQAQVEATPWLPDERPDDQRVALPDLDLHYFLHVTELSVETGFVRASETITIGAFNGPVPDLLYLQVAPAGYGYFTLDGLTLAGTPVEPGWLNDGATMVLDLPDDVVAPVEIGIDFQLNVGGPEPTGWGYLALDADVLRLGYWFPQISDEHPFSLTLDPSYTRIATFDVTLDLDAELQFSHSGELQGIDQLDDGRQRYYLHGENIRDFDLALSASYIFDSTVTQSGVVIEYAWRGDISPDVSDQVLSAASETVDRLTELIGPYPWPVLRIADGGPALPGGIEYGNLIWINPAYPQLDRLIYHEVAHMWLYGIIGTRTLEEGWIDEGGAEFFERGLASDFTEIPDPPPGGYCCPLDARWEELPQTGTDAYYAVYEQGQRFYMAVLQAMGWDPFWAAMQQIYARFALDIVTSYDILRAWQAHSPVDLRPLFNDTFRYPWIDDLPPPGVSSRQGWLPVQ